MTEPRHLVALISATPLAIPPALEGLAARFPEAEVWNLLDDRLLADAARSGGLTETLECRMQRLILHAVEGGADAVLLTCSMYGSVAHQTAAPVPVLAPDDAAFAAAADGTYSRVLLVASLESALQDSLQRLKQVVADRGLDVQVDGLHVPAALDAEDQGELVSTLVEACVPLDDEVDAVLLAQFSLASAQEGLAAALGRPVLSGPQSAAELLRSRLVEPRASGSLGAIADDYTGGTDVALAFTRAGLRTVLFFGPPPAETSLPPNDAVVVALKSRTAPVDEAVACSRAAWDWLTASGVSQVYFKYCSTFDSTAEGNIGPVLDALAAAAEAEVVVTTPSSPEHRRTVYGSHLYVDGLLLERSHMAHHPLTPMTSSYLPDLLAAQTARKVGALPLETVRQGRAQVRQEVERAADNGITYLVADAVEQADLRALARSLTDQPVVAGAAGLASALAEAQAGRVRTGSGGVPADPVGEVRSAVLAGSCSRRTLEQIADFTDRSAPGLLLDPLTRRTVDDLVSHALSWVDGLPSEVTPLIYSSSPPERLREVQQELGARAAAALLESALAQIARGLVRRGFRRIVSAGGETSGAIVDALGVRGVRVGAEVSPGVPWIHTLDDPPLALLLKSGNFGDVAMFSRAVDPEQHWGAR